MVGVCSSLFVVLLIDVCSMVIVLCCLLFVNCVCVADVCFVFIVF